ncbi:hypothetical protein [Nonomuraea glycinis]|uniref:hypothetical protein n=1 Tax=Nonomuraea glycinis TaxID=2047744 RepID=UPI0033A16F86
MDLQLVDVIVAAIVPILAAYLSARLTRDRDHGHHRDSAPDSGLRREGEKEHGDDEVRGLGDGRDRSNPST